MASLSLEAVSKNYVHRKEPVFALRAVDLMVEDGEFLVIVGPSGCGKTTSLRLIAGLERPDAGVIRIEQRVMNDVPAKDRDVAMVFQSYALYPHMSVLKNLAFPLKMRKVPGAEIRRKVQATAERLGIVHLLARKPGELSGGEQQRVALGRAIVRQPRVFLFDEPLSNLDPGLRVRMRSELKTLHKDLRTTIVYVTHDQEEAMTLADRVAVLRHGQLQQVAAPMTAYNAPANRFVAEFFGQPPMNFLDGRLVRHGQSTELVLAGATFPFPYPVSLADRELKVSLGIRPNHLVVGLPPSASSAGLPRLTNGRIDWIERLGDSVNLHIVTETGDRLRAKTAHTDGWQPGASVSIACDPAKVVVFKDGATGERLS